MNGLNVFLTFNLTRCFCLHNFHHEHQLHFCFFFSHCRHVFGIKHPKRERETCFSRQVVLKELLRSGLPSKVNVQVCPPSRHVGFVYLFPELLRRAGLCGYFFKEVWGKISFWHYSLTYYSLLSSFFVCSNTLPSCWFPLQSLLPS